MIIGKNATVGGSKVLSGAEELQNIELQSNAFMWGSDMPEGGCWSPDGLYYFAVSKFQNNRVFRWSVPIPFNVESTNNAFPDKIDDIPIANGNEWCTGLSFKPDGTKMYIQDANDCKIYQYNLSVAWNPESATYFGLGQLNPFLFPAPETNYTFNWHMGMYMKNDGIAVFSVNYSADYVQKFIMTTPWDITTLEFAGDPPPQFYLCVDPRDINFNPTGTRMYILTRIAPREVRQYNLSTGWDIENAVLKKQFSIPTVSSETPVALLFNVDYSNMYVVNSTKKIQTYNLLE